MEDDCVPELVELFKRQRYDLIGLTDKQIEAIGILRDDTTISLAFGGGANGGKSWLGCFWLAMMALTYPGTRWFIGREELKRITESTLITFYKVAKEYGISDTRFTYNGQAHHIQFSNGSRIALLDLQFLPSDPYYERFGSLEYTGGWIEEGGEIHQLAHEVLQTRVGRYLNDKYGIKKKMLVTCNPKKNWLYRDYWQPYKAGVLEPGRRFLQSLVGDNPKRESGSLEALAAIKDKLTRSRLFLGDWEYINDSSAIMEYDAIVGLYTNAHVKPDLDKKYITADIARLGRDNTVIRVWHGWVSVETVIMSKKKMPEVEQAILEAANKHGVPMRHIVIDEDGIGGGVVDHLPGCCGFVNNATPLPVHDKKENYSNLKSQCSFRIADRVNLSEIYITNEGEDTKASVIEEMEQVKRKDPDGDGKIAVIPKDTMKESLRRSPDLWDSIMMREYFEINSMPEPYIFI